MDDPGPSRTSPEPLAVDAVPTVAIGTAIWAVLGVLAGVFHSRLADDGHLWWIPTCIAGFLLGLLGLILVVRRRSRLGKRGAAAGE